MTDDTQRPDERVDDIEDILKTVRDGAIESHDAAAITRLNTALIAYRNLRYRAERAEREATRLTTALKVIERRTELGLFSRADVSDLDKALWDIRQSAKTALTAAADDEVRPSPPQG